MHVERDHLEHQLTPRGAEHSELAFALAGAAKVPAPSLAQISRPRVVALQPPALDFADTSRGLTLLRP